MGQRGAAGAEDDLGRDVDVELGLQGRRQVDLAQSTPNPCSESAARTAATAFAYGRSTVVLSV